MHHGDDPTATGSEQALRDEAARLRNLIGATGRYPDGRLNSDDEGEIAFAITSAGGKLVMNFGKPVAWIGMNRSDVVQLIKALQEHADRL